MDDKKEEQQGRLRRKKIEKKNFKKTFFSVTE